MNGENMFGFCYQRWKEFIILFQRANNGKVLSDEEISRFLTFCNELSDDYAKEGYHTVVRHYENKSELDEEDILNLYEVNANAKERGYDELLRRSDELVDSFFEDVEMVLLDGMSEAAEKSRSIDDIRERYKERINELPGEDGFEESRKRSQRVYLYTMRDNIHT